MIERERRGVEELALETQVAGGAVDGVAADEEVDRLEMDPDLMRAAGVERDREERSRAEQLQHLERGHGIARRRRIERVAGVVEPVAADRCLDAAAARARRALDER